MTIKQIIKLKIGAAAIAVTGSVLLLTGYTNTSDVQHTQHYKIVPEHSTNYAGVQPGDTLVFNGNYSYFTTPASGTKDNPVCMYMQNANFSNGLDFHDAAFFHIYGDGTDQSNYTFRMHGTGNGTPLSFQGRSHDIEIDHASIINFMYFVWFKHEGILDPCDTSAYVMNNFYLHDFYFDTAHQDGVYLMSTNEGSSRTGSCNGKTVNVVEYTGSNIRLKNGVIKNCQRNGINYSNISSGDSNYIDNVTIINCGYEYKLTHDAGALYQGAGIATGQFVKNLTIRNCTIKNTFLPGIVLRAGGNVSCYNNSIDSADYVWGTANSQMNAALQVTASDVYQTTWTIYGNNIGWSNNGVQMVLYKGKLLNASDNSCIEQTGNVVNNTGKTFITCDDSDYVPPPADTSITNVEIIFYRADGSTFRPLNWLKLLDRDSVYFVKYKDGKGRNYKKQTFGLFSK